MEIFKSNLIMKIDFEVPESSPMYQNINVLTSFHPGINWLSVFHRYHGPRAQYPAQGDFDDGLSTTRLFRGASSSPNPPKISRTVNSTFFRQLLFWVNANPFTELGASFPPRGSVCWGGSPSPNPTAYSQLDEMPHVLLMQSINART